MARTFGQLCCFLYGLLHKDAFAESIWQVKSIWKPLNWVSILILSTYPDIHLWFFGGFFLKKPLRELYSNVPILGEISLSFLMRLWGQRANKDTEGNQSQEKISLPFSSSWFCNILALAFILSYKCWAIALLIDCIKINLVWNTICMTWQRPTMTTYWPHLTSFWISHWYLIETLFIIKRSRLSGFDYVSDESPRESCFVAPCLGSEWLSFSAKSCIPVCTGGTTAAEYKPCFPAATCLGRKPHCTASCISCCVVI